MVAQGVGIKLLAILAADAAGYSRLVAADDVGALQALDVAREVFHTHVAAHDGRVVYMAGDSVLAVFDTATGAVSAALAIRQALTERAGGARCGRPASRKLTTRPLFVASTSKSARPCLSLNPSLIKSDDGR
jgi:class 3 adenylate cyclase